MENPEMRKKTILTSESVTEGHPDKVCDYIADSVLDAYIGQDSHSRVACEVLCKGDTVILAGEITSKGKVDLERVVREAVREIGYVDPENPFHADTLQVVNFISSQSPEIAAGIHVEAQNPHELGAGDQGIMYGYATDETPELMPLPIHLAHRLAEGLANDRKSGRYPWLRPDGKTQVSVIYENGRPVKVTDIIIAAQHSRDISQEEIVSYAKEDLAPRILGDWHHPEIRIFVNTTGSFVVGGPVADCGLTGRKNMVDTYGGIAHHGGGALSGKDPTKVDRSAAYFCRYVARQIVLEGIARRVEVQVAYSIGLAQPLAICADCFGTGNEHHIEEFIRKFDFRPAAIIERLDLLRPIYSQTTNYGHFGKPWLPWER